MSQAVENEEIVGIRASATTLNSEEPIVQEPATPARHLHGPNFGRYVEGCPGCIAKYPNGPTSAKRTRVRRQPQAVTAAAPSASAPVVTVAGPSPTPVAPIMTMDQVLEMVRLLREPDEETKLKREQEKAFRERRNREMLELARIEIQQKKALQDNCGHMKQNGTSTIHPGQVHSDGLQHPICVRCGYRPEPNIPNVGAIVGGVQ